MEKYDVFLQAGQSNAVGTGHGPVDAPYIPDERIVYLNGWDVPSDHSAYLNGWDAKKEGVEELCVTQIADERPFADDANDRIGDFSLTFAQDYIRAGLLAPDRKILIVRTAVGGTGFMFNQWEMDAPLYKRMLTMTDHAMSLGQENRLMALLWHQGEHEAFEGNTPERYHGQLLDLINSVKTRYDRPDLPFICGGFCDQWVQKYLQSCTDIMQVLKDVAAEMDGIFLETHDLLSNDQSTGDGDDIHFCRQSLRDLGHRYFEAYKTIVGR